MEAAWQCETAKGRVVSVKDAAQVSRRGEFQDEEDRVSGLPDSDVKKLDNILVPTKPSQCVEFAETCQREPIKRFIVRKKTL